MFSIISGSNQPSHLSSSHHEHELTSGASSSSVAAAAAVAAYREKRMHKSSSKGDEQQEQVEKELNFNEKRVILNVGGVRHEVMWKNLEKLPNSRLGRIRFASSIEQIQDYCDDLSVENNEIFFDRHSNSFNTVINFYRTGKLHLVEDVCIMSFHDDLNYWGIDEIYFETCCHLKYHNKKEMVSEEIKKEEEALNDTKNDEQFSVCFPRVRRKVWDLMENPHTSFAARVCIFCSYLIIYFTFNFIWQVEILYQYLIDL
jgi:hypothetical protein